MNEQKLKEKLAEFAGFVEKTGKYYPEEHTSSYGKYWAFPDESHQYGSEPPDFIHSLDLCFKWLPVPSMSVGKDIDARGKVYFIGVASLDGLNNSYGEDKTSTSLALCLAIEKLIDGEKYENGR